MKNMKYGILFGIALVGVMLFTACDNIIDNVTPENDTPVKDGYGRVSINLTGDGTAQESARTVLPSTAFDKYVYTFKKTGSATGTVIEPVNGYFIIEAGSYTVEVQAYIGAAEPYILAATGVSSQFNVGSESNTKIEVRLSSVSSAGQTGKFSYTITYPEGAAAGITLQQWPGMGNVTLTPGTLSEGNGITQTELVLPVGSYLLTVFISKDGLCAGKNEAVRIYTALVTEYTKDFTDDDLLTAIPPTVNAAGTLLTVNTWENGDVSANGDQWFKFTATAASHYIHVELGTLTNLYVQLYDFAGVAVGSRTNLTGSVTSVLRSAAVGQVYYIKVSPYSSGGTYRISFNTSQYPPTIKLTAGAWADCAVYSTGYQWFEFTATAGTQYIHAAFGTLNPSNGFNVQLYNSTDSAASPIGSQTNLKDSSRYTSQSLTSGQAYYIKVTAYNSSDTGTYRIAFNASSATPPPSGNASVTPLAANTWSDGTVSVNGEQWFSFTAASGTNYIHSIFGTLNSSNGFNVQLYDSTGSTVGSQTRLYSGSRYTSRSLTNGQTYYIKVTPYSSGDSGTYQITYNTSSYPPIPSSGITSLTSGTWTDGAVSANGEQWYSFTAAAGANYIHSSFGTLNPLNGLYVQIYDSTGNSVISQTRLYSDSRYTSSSSLTSGQTYYIKVTPYSSNYGTYQITFNTSGNPPLPSDSVITTITANTWADGNVTAYGEQWFKFTATASTQYIHSIFGTLNSSNGFNVHLYDSTGSPTGSQTNLTGSSRYTSRSLTSGQMYYIKVTSSYGGTYQITFNTSTTPPPPSDSVITTLTANTWADGNVSGEQWFKFTATASTQYIHVAFGTLTNLYIQVYNQNNAEVGNQTQLYSSNTYISRSVTSGQTYYIKVTPYSSGYSGTYQITFNTSSTSPSPALPGSIATATTLSAGVWADGAISTNEWFKFTATSSTHYIHASFGTLGSWNGFYVQVYSSTGSTIGGQTQLYSSNTYTSRSVTSGQTYYIRVTPYSGYSGTYQITFNTSSTAPSPTLPGSSAAATMLSAGVWADGTLSSSGEQWFKFTATSSTHYIHASSTLIPYNDFYVQVYGSSGNTVVSQTRLSSSNSYISSSSFTSGQTYYIRVSTAVTFQITYNTTSTPPLPSNSATATTLTVSIWEDETISSNSEQWFKFTATSSTHYIHASFGTLGSWNGFYVQVYSSTGSTIGGQTQLYSSNTYTSRSVTSGQTYYIKVWPYYSSSSGTYQIAFNTTSTPPLPNKAATATTISAGVWEYISSNSEQWFKFTATTSSTHYIHASFSGTLSYLDYFSVLVYGSSDGSSGNIVVSQSLSYTGTHDTNFSVTSGQTYYIKVTSDSGGTGTYKIAFNTSSTPPSP